MWRRLGKKEEIVVELLVFLSVGILQKSRIWILDWETGFVEQISAEKPLGPEALSWFPPPCEFIIGNTLQLSLP